ncbi:MAG: hypothetical protein E6J68_15555 [Deltaproteobacteria bacterium]|nr:MAG: hypothetical protein E6J68_15555 [Deltaproteobacteria bacterium]TMA70340.1 MAG: hypothetical protein E6J69_02965 [Deltaproteobacteria bacterium]
MRRPEGARVMGVRGAAGLVVVMLLSGCAGIRWVRSLTGPPAFNEGAFARKPIATYRIPAAPDDTVIGRLGTYRIRAGETFFEVARYYDLGYGELVEANPGIDPILPPVGARVVLPTAWILPCCTYEGIVVNVPEMRLYFYRHPPGEPRTLLVETYPIGIGREGWRTPRGKFHIRGKTVNPQWVIPESIRQEHIREYGDDRRSIAGGDPDNPLGKYRMELSLPPFSIHGTDVPWGIGMQVTHGCVRLYPEDIQRLFPLAPVGTRVDFTYQPVKVGRRQGAVYVEVHRDVYRYGGPSYRRALAALTRQGLGGGVDSDLVKAALRSSAGVPFRVSPAGVPARTS